MNLLFYIIISVYSLFGKKNIIFSFLFLFVFSLLNTGFGFSSFNSAIGRYLVFFTCFLATLYRLINSKKFKLSKYFILTVSFYLFIIIHSILFSNILEISILKSFLWYSFFFTIFITLSMLGNDDFKSISSFVFNFLVVILILSIPLLKTDIGYFVNQNGFQGILNHPQAFGSVMSILATWSLINFLTLERFKLIYFIIFVISTIFIILSEARTALLAFVMSFFISIIFYFFAKRKRLTEIFPTLQSSHIKYLYFLLIFIAVFSFVEIVNLTSDFLQKGGRSDGDNFQEIYENSRGRLYIPMLSNIQNNFYSGIGFGISSDYQDLEISRDPTLGIPTSAPIEKGIVILAVFEELGLFGFILFLLWLFSSIISIFKSNVLFFSLATCVFLMNFGESVLFSPGGLGMLHIIIFIMSVLSSKKISQIA